MIKICYALQTCDIASNQNHNNRYCKESKSTITQHCSRSFFKSVAYAAEKNPEAQHHIMIYDDRSTAETVAKLQQMVSEFTRPNVQIEFQRLANQGIMQSIRACYEWLRDQQCDLVYQVQDDYLFIDTAVLETIDIFMQVHNATGSHSIISPYHDPYYSYGIYPYRTIPRVLIPGKGRYWLQGYDVSCSFLTSNQIINEHWDLFDAFCSKDSMDNRLEADTLNKLMVDRGILNLFPVESLTLHMQGDLERDPYIDWKARWAAV